MKISSSNSKFGPSGTGTFRNSKLASGAALMLSLWALFLLSAMVISWALDIDSRLTLSGNANRRLEAEAMACSGAEVALHPLIKPGSPNLSGGLGAGKSYETHITGEGGRLDLNWYTSAAAGSGGVEVLRRYLENKGIDLNERDLMVDALLDWVESNVGLHHLNAPPESDTYHPAHAPLTRVDELKQVAGWAEFTSVAGWDDDFTVNTRTGVDLAWASRDVLLALPGVTPQMADRFLELRRGPDGVDGTKDDAPFKNKEDALIALGFNQNQFSQLEAVLSPTMPVPVFRVVSVGKAGDATRVVQMVFRRVAVAAQAQLITWKEF